MRIDSAVEDAKTKIEHSIKNYEAFRDHYKSYKEGEHSKISTFMYGLVAVSIFALFTGNGSGVVHKFCLTYSVIFTLVGYYFWYLVDALMLTLIHLCSSVVECNRKIFTELSSKGVLLDPESFIIKRTLEYELAIKNYYKFTKFTSWSCLITLILAALMVLLGVFWVNFTPPSLLKNAMEASYQSVFYWTLLWMTLIIIFFQGLYYKMAKDYLVKGSLE